MSEHIIWLSSPSFRVPLHPLFAHLTDATELFPALPACPPACLPFCLPAVTLFQIVKPLWEPFVTLFPKLSPLLENLNNNCDYYFQEGLRLEERRLSAVPATSNKTDNNGDE